MKKRVGVVPNAHLFETDDPYKDQYIFVNNYARRIAANGGIPLGILPTDGYALEETLEECDAFVFCGGNRIFPYHFQAMEHALKENKTVLGICLGMQVMHSVLIVQDEAQRRGWQGSLLSLYEAMKRERYMFTEPVAHHWDVNSVRDRMDACKHPVQVIPGTRLHSLLGQEQVRAVTLHRYRITTPSERAVVSARALDDTIEGIELGERAIGVQFHPEVEDELDALFRFVTK